MDSDKCTYCNINLIFVRETKKWFCTKCGHRKFTTNQDYSSKQNDKIISPKPNNKDIDLGQNLSLENIIESYLFTNKIYPKKLSKIISKYTNNSRCLQTIVKEYQLLKKKHPKEICLIILNYIYKKDIWRDFEKEFSKCMDEWNDFQPYSQQFESITLDINKVKENLRVKLRKIVK